MQECATVNADDVDGHLRGRKNEKILYRNSKSQASFWFPGFFRFSQKFNKQTISKIFIFVNYYF